MASVSIRGVTPSSASKPSICERRFARTTGAKAQPTLANYWLGLLASHARRFDEGREAASHAYQVSGSPQALAACGYVEAASESVESAEAILYSLAHSDNGYVAHSGICQIYVALGHLDRAAGEWTLAQTEGDWELGWAAPDPRWNALRGKVPGI